MNRAKRVVDFEAVSDRQRVAELMVAVHLVSRELADLWAEEMDDAEVEHRLKMYARLSAETELGVVAEKSKSGKRVSHPVFTSRDDDGTASASSPVSELPTRVRNQA